MIFFFAKKNCFPILFFNFLFKSTIISMQYIKCDLIKVLKKIVNRQYKHIFKIC